MEKFSSAYWDRQYLEKKLRCDIGYVSPPIRAYIDQLEDKSLRVLVPGAGNAYEVEYLYESGFLNTFFLDFSGKSIENFLARCPDFPQKQILKEDFFTHKGQYDLIIEQTFFSSVLPQQRGHFVDKLHELLTPGGKFAGLLFNHHFPFMEPPFGGTEEEYRKLFGKLFRIDIMETATNSIKPRIGRELFVKLSKPDC